MEPTDAPLDLFGPLETSPPADASEGEPTESSPTSEPDAEIWRARVMLNEPVGLLDYRIPPEFVGQLLPGQPVRVPLGKRRTSAYIAEVKQGPHPSGLSLKDLLGIDPERPALPPAVMQLLLFGAQYYGVTPGEMLGSALPAMARPASARYRLSDTAQQLLPHVEGPDAQVLQLAKRFPKGFTVAAIERDLGCSRAIASTRLRKLCQQGLLERAVGKKPGAKQSPTFSRVSGADPSVLSARQQGARQLFELIPPSGSIELNKLMQQDPNARGRLKALMNAGLVTRTAVAVRHVPFPVEGPAEEGLVTPTTDQAAAMLTLTAAIDAEAFKTVLLHGVTGSGKTEVYLRAIAHALDRGHTALILVPEIALTPQLGERFRSRFGDRVATFHSGLTPAERRDEWERVARGEASIGLGARSALFLPLKRLGIIIVDEEHETSFKQDETPRYNARDLAVYRGSQDNAVVVLGSATPSLETYCNAEAKRYERILLPCRVSNRPLPEVECVNLAEAERVGDGVFTERLARALERTLTQGEQAILFLNRRGFAPYVYCQDCGHAYRCDECEVSLTLHRKRNVLMCHYCGFETMAPDACDSCQGHRVGAFGLGTERVEAEVRALFGNVPTLRLDRDVVRKKSDLERMLSTFRDRKAPIMIGTQMVAKGHDFPGVTLVGVIAADASLNFPDFRAAERTFQLLTQVAGRAGRSTAPGFVLVQAYEVEHYAIAAARRHDYETFVAQELIARKELGYPPYTHLALLRFEGPHEMGTEQAAQQTAEVLQAKVATHQLPVAILGPAAAPLTRLRGLWRFHILLKGQTRHALQQLLRQLPRSSRNDVRRVLDVDPVSML